jgi:hypothetical protein
MILDATDDNTRCRLRRSSIISSHLPRCELWLVFIRPSFDEAIVLLALPRRNADAGRGGVPRNPRALRCRLPCVRDHPGALSGRVRRLRASDRVPGDECERDHAPPAVAFRASRCGRRRRSFVPPAEKFSNQSRRSSSSIAPDWKIWIPVEGDPRHGTEDDPRYVLIGVDVHSAVFLEVDKCVHHRPTNDFSPAPSLSEENRDRIFVPRKESVRQGRTSVRTSPLP